MIVLDASVLIAYFDDTDTHHAAAARLLAEAVADDLVANPLTLAEILVRPAQDGRLDGVLGALRDLDVAELPFPSDTAVRLARLRVATGLRMPDCCVLLAAETAGGRVACFDDRLTRAAEKRGIETVRA